MQIALSELVDRALAEDVGAGDLTTEATVPVHARARALITQKVPGVVFGVEMASEVFRRLDPAVAIEPLTGEGAWRDGGPVVRVEGSARGILTAERTALNFLQRLSGVATLTARCVQAVAGTQARILDTRKTTPGLRALEKAAVAAGGGTNHRAGLYDAILIKENHAVMAGGVGPAVRQALGRGLDVPIEVECRSLAEVAEAVEAGATWIMLDNMTLEQMREAVDYVRGRARLEASGGVTVERLKAIAGTGVEFISVGALTHSAPALDLSLLLEPTP